VMALKKNGKILLLYINGPLIIKTTVFKCIQLCVCVCARARAQVHLLHAKCLLSGTTASLRNVPSFLGRGPSHKVLRSENVLGAQSVLPEGLSCRWLYG
jgi:hypothetical protein